MVYLLAAVVITKAFERSFHADTVDEVVGDLDPYIPHIPALLQQRPAGWCEARLTVSAQVALYAVACPVADAIVAFAFWAGCRPPVLNEVGLEIVVYDLGDGSSCRLATSAFACGCYDLCVLVLSKFS